MEKEKVINQRKTEGMLAFEELEELIKTFNFPKDFDWKAERAQALEEKYGYFD